MTYYFCLQVFPAPGDLLHLHRYDFGIDNVEAVALTPDSKVVVGIRGTGGALQCVWIARFNSSATNRGLDFTFGNNGIVQRCQSLLFTLSDVAVQNDKRTVFVGRIRISDFGGAIAYAQRLNEDGSNDLDFGQNGLARIDSPFSPEAVEVQNDGKILIAGTEANDFKLLRLLPNGSIDSSFGVNGTVSIDFSNSESAYSVVTGSDGSIYAVGDSIRSETNESWCAVAKLRNDGVIDVDFAVKGKLLFQFSGYSTPWSAALQPDGKIVIAGRTRVNGVLHSAAARLQSNGQLDFGFAENGKYISQFGSLSEFRAVAIQTNGKIVLGGVANFATEDFILERLQPDGGLDKTFGNNGRVRTEVPNRNDSITDLAVQGGSGEIVVVGMTVQSGSSNWDLVLASYEGDARPRSFDFDGDRKTDVSIFRPNGGSGGGEWWYLRSSDGGNRAFAFGSGTDTIVPADFTGDGKSDLAFWRPASGEWFVLRSEDSTFFAFPFGASGDIPAPADYDGDGRSDATVYRPSTNTWFTLRSSDGQVSAMPFGTAGDKPVPADYDGDGKADVAIFRPTGGSGGGEWWYLRSSDGANRAFAFGSATDLTVPGDYTGDGKADIAYFRPSTGEWYVLRSEDSSFYAFPWGANGDLPAPGDYDGDGKIDAAVFRPSNSNWFALRSTAGPLILQFGITGDRPVPNAFVR